MRASRTGKGGLLRRYEQDGLLVAERLTDSLGAGQGSPASSEGIRQLESELPVETQPGHTHEVSERPA